MVEGLLPAIPHENFVRHQKPGRLVRPKRDSDFVSSNIIDTYIRNNDRGYNTKPCRTDQYRNSFFYRTVVDWNHLDNNTVHADSITGLKTALV